jgi:cysteine desulfurase
MSDRIAYLDHAAAARLDPRVADAMRPFLDSEFGSPGAVHDWGRVPALALERARAQVAALVGAPPEWVIFTSGASEARNLAVKGLAAANRGLGRHLAISAVEHPATRAAARTVAKEDGRLTEVGVDGEGRVPPDALAEAVAEDTALVCLVHGQAELGTVQNPAPLVAAVRARRGEARVHVDAGETAGRVPIDLVGWDCDALTIGGWPMAAPPWAGALVVREGARLRPLIEGGLQEAGKRSGAEILPGAVALGTAAEIAGREMADRAARLEALAERLRAGLLAEPGVRLNGPRAGRIPGHVQVSTGDVEGETLALALAARGIAVSPGSACTAIAGKAAPALTAIGMEPPWTHSAVLFTLGPDTTEAEVDAAVAAWREVLPRMREMSPLAP